MTDLHLPTLITAHAWVLLALTILIGALYRVTKFPGSISWFLSDIAGLVGIYAFYGIITDPNRINFFLFALSTSLSLYLRVLAICSPLLAKRLKATGLTVISLQLLFNLTLDQELFVLRTFLNSTILAGFSLTLAYVLFRPGRFNDRLGRSIMLMSSLAYIAVALFRAIYVIKTGTNDVFIASFFNIVSATMLMVSGVLANIGYVIMIINQINHAESLAAQNLIREAERRLYAEEREREASALAEEQKRLIEVLTHEVHQPLNNASAALQAITTDLSRDAHQEPHPAIERAQSVIDKVTAALSNALVAGTIIERRQSYNPARCEIRSLIETVVMEFNTQARSRIKVDVKEAPAFVTADPILLRIALRNLVDNALRYSPANTLVSISIYENNIEMGAEFCITNEEPNPEAFPKEDIFARHVRGTSPEIRGSGMGLYIASEVAKLHQGWINTESMSNFRIFRLFIPD